MAPFGASRAGLMSTRVDAIPDSVLLQYKATEVAAGDTTWPDDNDVADMTLTGNESDETMSDGSESLGFDGDNDHGLIDFSNELSNEFQTEYTIELAFETTESSETSTPIGFQENDNQRIQTFLNRDENFNSDDGNLLFRITDDSDNRLIVAFDSSPNLNDGTRQNLSIVVEDASSNDVKFILNGVEEDVSIADSDGPNNFVDWTRDFTISAYNREGSIEAHSEIDYGALRLHDEAIDEQTIGDYV